MLAYRFEGDPFCKAQRFAAYEAALGDRFQGRVLPDASALQGTPMPPHSVVTLHLIDRAGEPTRAAREQLRPLKRRHPRAFSSCSASWALVCQPGAAVPQRS